MNFFTSDHHFGHSGIVLHCNRPFKTLEEMDKYLINQWNSVVKPGDHVYYLGDMFWYNAEIARSILFKLRGKIHFIQGNHDATAKKLAQYFSSFELYRVLKSDHQLFVLFHYPIHDWDGMYHGGWHLHGHSHGRCDSSKILRYDVGVDTNNFTPVSEDQIIEIMQKKKKEN